MPYKTTYTMTREEFYVEMSMYEIVRLDVVDTLAEAIYNAAWEKLEVWDYQIGDFGRAMHTRDAPGLLVSFYQLSPVITGTSIVKDWKNESPELKKWLP